MCISPSEPKNNELESSSQINLFNPYFNNFPTNNNPVRLAILASGNGSNFEAIIHKINNHSLNAKIVILIVNNIESGAIKRAKKYNIEYLIVEHRGFRNRSDHEQAILEILNNKSVDLIIMAGWMRIVTPLLINSFPNRILNIHPSLLPSFKGINAIQQALDCGVKYTGCTVHLVEENVDSGKILMQAVVPITSEDDIKSLTIKIQNLEHEILPISISLHSDRLMIKDKRG